MTENTAATDCRECHFYLPCEGFRGASQRRRFAQCAAYGLYCDTVLGSKAPTCPSFRRRARPVRITSLNVFKRWLKRRLA